MVRCSNCDLELTDEDEYRFVEKVVMCLDCHEEIFTECIICETEIFVHDCQHDPEYNSLCQECFDKHYSIGGKVLHKEGDMKCPDCNGTGQCQSSKNTLK